MDSEHGPLQVNRYQRSIRLRAEEVQALLARLDKEDAPAELGPNRRRCPYRMAALRVQLLQPGESSSRRYAVPTRWLSQREMAFLHGGYVHAGTWCQAQLISLHGTWEDVEGVVRRCCYVGGHIHEVEVCFNVKIDLAAYCTEAMCRRVLLAEDEPMIVRAATFQLQQLNAKVDHANDGIAAVQRALRQPYDIILMDTELPKLTGFEATAVLRTKGYSGAIAAFCAIRSPQHRAKLLNCGFDAIVPKPFTRDDLANVFEATATELLHSSYHADGAMSQLLNSFVQQLPDILKEIRNALCENNRHLLIQLAASLKEAGGSYGFEPISTASAALEASLVNGDPLEKASAKVDQLLKLAGLIRGPSKPKH